MALGHLARERKTVLAMIALFCRKKHQGGLLQKPLCPNCQELSQYAAGRVERCIFGEQKPACVKCPVHCYRKDMRERIRVVMRAAGPAMALHHPYLALRHLWVSRFYKIPTLRKYFVPSE